MANVTIPDLTANNAPSTNTLLEVSDSSATPVSGKASPVTLVPLGLDMANLVAFTDTSGALSVESSVVDGPTAVAFSFDTADALADGEAKIASFLNNSALKAYVASSGGVIVGANTAFWETPSAADAFKSYKVVTLGDNDSNRIIVGVIDEDELETEIRLVTTFDAANITLVVTGDSRFRYNSAGEGAGVTGLYLWDTDNGTLQQVTLGAADSGGTGFRVLRIPNAP